MMSALSITIVGAGRVGEALAKTLYNNGCAIRAILSRSKDRAIELAAATNSEYLPGYSVPSGTNLVIIAVPDHALAGVAGRLEAEKGCLVVHTAGSLGFEVFPLLTPYDRGVLYPLQTFSLSREIDLRSVPVIIDGESEKTINLLKTLASLISESVHILQHEQRIRVHLSAVFVCNFVNHMLSSGEKIAKDAGVDFALFEPLVKETILKAFELGPAKSQTGPAVRNDINTIEKHIDLLSYDSHMRDIYRVVSESIISKHSQ